jgi:hypothetical protein
MVNQWSGRQDSNLRHLRPKRAGRIEAAQPSPATEPHGPSEENLTKTEIVDLVR